MRLPTIFFLVIARLVVFSAAYSQITTFPYSENFDGVTAPALPFGWGGNGFAGYASSPHSSPNCVYATGNRSIKTLISPILNLSTRIPDKLIFWERRTSTAVPFRLEVRASIDGNNFTNLLARYDTITSTSSYVQRTIDLSNSGLKFQLNVQFEWLILADSTNNTGVLRIDDISLSVVTGYDVGLTKLSCSPPVATRKDTLSLSAVIKNYGVITASGVSIRFFSDRNLNGIAESSEQFSVTNELTLNPGDSLTCTAIHLPLKAGEYRFIAVVDLPQDENRTNDTVRTTINVGYVKSDMLVNEIMYAPTGDEPEWVELFNASSDTINLKNWRISDSNISTKTVITTNDYLFLPNNYIVIAKSTDFSLIHPSMPFLLANFSALNNTTTDAVVIYDPQLNTIDSVMYAPSWGGQNGKSLERIDVEAPSIAMTNWIASQDSLGSTPGKINSNARLDYDLTITRCSQELIIVSGKNIPRVDVFVKNVGRNSVDTLIVKFFADYNQNEIAEQSELLTEKNILQSLVPGDSIQSSETFYQLQSGETNIIVIADWWRDERLRDNQLIISTKVEYEFNSVVINEIIFEPLSGQNEWIELLNRSDRAIDLKNWMFNDKPTSSGVNSFKISNQTLIVRSGEFAVVAAESSLFQLFPNLIQSDSTSHIVILNRSGGFSFNNDGDDIVLKDITGKIVDSVSYSPRWHHPEVTDTRGRSLERINQDINSNDSRNWSTCTNITGGTPGKSNSILTTGTQKNTRISISPNPFSPDGDGFEDFCIIRYNLPMMTSTINIKIYDIKGRLIRTLANGEVSGYTREIIWDGFGDDKQRARIGVYVIFLEASDRASGRVETAKAVAVVATKL